MAIFGSSPDALSVGKNTSTAGPLTGNPDNLLGSRVPHCFNQEKKGKVSYKLVKET